MSFLSESYTVIHLFLIVGPCSWKDGGWLTYPQECLVGCTCPGSDGLVLSLVSLLVKFMESHDAVCFFFVFVLMSLNPMSLMLRSAGESLLFISLLVVE